MTAALSIVGFTLRYAWMITDSPVRSLRVVKVGRTSILFG